MQRVYQSRDELAEGAEPNTADLDEGNRAHDQHHQEKVQQHSASVETVDLRGGDDTSLAVPRRQVRRRRLLFVCA